MIQLPDEAREAYKTIPLIIRAAYAATVRATGAPNYPARFRVYDYLRANVPDNWEARNTRPVKLALDTIDLNITGRDTSSDWKTMP